MEERDGTRDEDRTVEEQVPLHVVPVRETIAAADARNTSQRVREAPNEKTSAPGKFLRLPSFLYFAKCVIGHHSSLVML